MWLLVKYSYVTVFLITEQIVTVGLFHFSGSANSYTRTLHICAQCHYQTWLTGVLFWSKFCQPCLFTTKTMGSTEGATWKEWVWNSTSDGKTSLKSSKHVWTYGTLGLIASPNSSNKVFNPPLAIHSPLPPASLPPTPYNVPSVILQ